MDYKESQNLRWKLIAEENGKRFATYDCPSEVVGDIVEILFKAEQGETCLPNSTMREYLQRIIDKNELYKEVIIKVTGIEEEYIQRLLSGVMEPLETNKLILLTEILDRCAN